MDDQALILEAIAALLRAHGVEHGIKVVACAKNYHQVLEAVQQQRPHLLLLDMHMPEINGSEVAYKLKKHMPELKIVMLSSFESLQEVAQAKAAGADGYAFKYKGDDLKKGFITHYGSDKCDKTADVWDWLFAQKR